MNNPPSFYDAYYAPYVQAHGDHYMQQPQQQQPPPQYPEQTFSPAAPSRIIARSSAAAEYHTHTAAADRATDETNE